MNQRGNQIPDVLRRVKEGIVDGSADKPFLCFVDRLVVSRGAKFEPHVVADYVAYTAATQKGTNSSTHFMWREHLNQIGFPDSAARTVPCPSTVLTHVDRFKPAKPSLTGFDDAAMARTFDAFYRAVFQAAQDLYGWKDHEFYVALDVTPMPSYSTLDYVYDKVARKRRVVGARSRSGLIAGPQFRRKGKSTQPHFNGTTIGHDFLVMSAHHYETKITLPLAVRLLYPGGPNQHTAFLDALDLLESYPAPGFILADSGFCTKEATAALAAFCRRHPGTHYMVPMRSFSSNQKPSRHRPIGRSKPRRLMPQGELLEAFHSRVAMPKHPNTWFARGNWSWTARSKSERAHAVIHPLVFFYRRVRPEDELTELDEALDDSKFGPGIVGSKFITDVEVSLDNCDTLADQYRLRWGIENLFKRHKEEACRIPSHEPLMRVMGFNLSLLLFGCHGLWRWNRAVRRKIGFDHPQTSLYLFTQAVRTQIEQRVAQRARQ